MIEFCSFQTFSCNSYIVWLCYWTVLIIGRHYIRYTLEQNTTWWSCNKKGLQLRELKIHPLQTLLVGPHLVISSKGQNGADRHLGTTNAPFAFVTFERAWAIEGSGKWWAPPVIFTTPVTNTCINYFCSRVPVSWTISRELCITCLGEPVYREWATTCIQLVKD